MTTAKRRYKKTPKKLDAKFKARMLGLQIKYSHHSNLKIKEETRT
jgi:hypothetical protein